MTAVGAGEIDLARQRAAGHPLRRLWRRKTPYLFLAPVLLTLAAVVLYPILFNFWLSLHETRLIAADLGPTVWLENYQKILRDDDFWNALRVSLTFTFASVVFAFVIGFALALIMNEVGRARPVFMALLLVPWIISPVVIGYSWRWLFNDQFGLINKVLLDLGLIERNVTWLAKPDLALGAVIVANVWRFVPYMMIMLLAGLQSIPTELYEAAEVDGATMWQKFVSITVSELRYIIGVVSLFSIIWSFNDFAIPFIMTEGGPSDATTVLPILVYRTAFDALRMGRGAALAVIILLILLIFSVVYVRRLLRPEAAS